MDTSAEHQHSGFTLIELLTVVVIIATIAAMVVPNLRSDPHRLLENHSKNFVGHMTQMSEEAAMRGMEFGLIVDEHSYHFVHWNEDQDRWQEMPISSFARTIELPEALNLELELSDEAELRVFSSEDFANDFNPNSQNTTLNDEPEPVPHVALLSSGEITPFSLSIQAPDNQELLVTYNLLGDVDIERIDSSF